MANIIFGFSGNEITLPMDDVDAKRLFYNITGVSIIDEKSDIEENESMESIKSIDLKQYQKEEKKMVHPTRDQLVELFGNNLDKEITSKLIKDTFYPNYRGDWRRIIPNIYDKIQSALNIVEITEDGKFFKGRDGKFVTYTFIRNHGFNKTLDDFLN